MDTNKEYLTKEKHKELTQELKELQTVKRKEVAEQLEAARLLGDLSENAEYHEARDNQGKIESRIIQLDALLKNAEIVKPTKGDTAELASTVTVKRVKDSETFTYTLVGSEEADFSEGKISHQSPLGSAILGKKKGEEFNFETPKGKVKYKVMKVD